MKKISNATEWTKRVGGDAGTRLLEEFRFSIFL
jgi:hypothetical protein